MSLSIHSRALDHYCYVLVPLMDVVWVVGFLNCSKNRSWTDVCGVLGNEDVSRGETHHTSYGRKQVFICTKIYTE